MEPINWADVVAQQKKDMVAFVDYVNDPGWDDGCEHGHRTGFEDCAKWLQLHGYIVLEDVK